MHRRPSRRRRLRRRMTRLRPPITCCHRLCPLTLPSITHLIAIWVQTIATIMARAGLHPHRGVGGSRVVSGGDAASLRLAGSVCSVVLAISIVSIMAVASTMAAAPAMAAGSAKGTTRTSGTMIRMARRVSLAHPPGPAPRCPSGTARGLPGDPPRLRQARARPRGTVSDSAAERPRPARRLARPGPAGLACARRFLPVAPPLPKAEMAPGRESGALRLPPGLGRASGRTRPPCLLPPPTRGPER